MRILVAEDNRDSRELLQEILETMGHEVVLAFDGVNALELARDKPFDLFILDVDMPRKSGFEVAAELKNNPSSAHIPIIILTARSDIESRVTGLGLGAEDYLAKPFNPRELIARVNTRLRAKTETDGLRQQEEAIRRTFARFVAPEVIEYMIKHPAQVKLGGQLREITVFFADLQGFTTYAEQQEPEIVLQTLNRYHELLVNVVQKYGGIVDKFLGDGLMALFNAPIDLEDHVFKAVQTALEIKSQLQLSQYHADSTFRLGINIGIHTGRALVGNVGASSLMDYTAVGDTVNLAARLQVMASNNSIFVSDAVYEQVRGRVLADDMGLRTIKGRAELVRVYDLRAFL